MLPDFKRYYKAIVVKSVFYWNKHIHTAHWESTESLEVNSFIYHQLTSDQKCQINWGKETASLTNEVRKTVYPHAYEFLGLNIRLDFIKLLE